MMTKTSTRRSSRGVIAACTEMVPGNPEPWLAMWSKHDPVADKQLRVTQIYRREDGAWNVAHRHGDTVHTIE